MFICEECGNTFEKPSTYVNKINNKSFQVCPHCGGVDYAGAVQCAMCGDYISEMKNGVCDDCIENQIVSQDGENYVREDTSVNYVAIPRFLAFVYSADEIGQLIRRDYDKLPKTVKRRYIRSFINDEKEDFATYLVKKKGGNNVYILYYI